MEIPFSLTRTKTNSIIYRIHPLFRIFSLCVSLVLLFASLSFDRVIIAGLCLSAISLLGALYDERWLFDATHGEIHYWEGFFPLRKFQKWHFSKISKINISRFMKGLTEQHKIDNILKKSETRISSAHLFFWAPETRIRLRLIIEFTDGSSMLINETGFRNSARINHVAQLIREATGLELSGDT